MNWQSQLRKKIPLLLLFAGNIIICSAQALTSHNPEIGAAREKLNPAFKDFGSCIAKSELRQCMDELIKKAPDNYSQYNVAGLLFKADTAASYRLHQQAYLTQPDDEDFLLQYAIELHRRGQYEQASQLYEKYLDKHPGQVSLYTWLTDCYMNLDKTAKAMELWAKAGQPKNQSSVDAAINTIYGKSDNIAKRNAWRVDLTKGQKSIAPTLIYLDANWKLDPNNKIMEEDFLTADMDLAKQKLDSTSAAFKQLKVYIAIKRLSKENRTAMRDSVKSILKAAGLILEGKPLPDNGAIASDLVLTAITTGVLDEKVLVNTRGPEILKLAKSNKDADMLSLYTTLLAGTKGAVDPAINKMGWKEFKDERFAAAYFIGKGENNKHNDPELAQAMVDFPGSAILYWVKINCARVEGKPMKALFIELIKREFKTLGSDPNHSSTGLQSYFGYLAQQK
ncbi:MAG: hypothetical protein JWO03_2664 [Bacteroidetes bacterium]|nr:hypothetical protein [Bacteroidota bacterium]